jgi:hypothetical protein
MVAEVSADLLSEGPSVVFLTTSRCRARIFRRGAREYADPHRSNQDLRQETQRVLVCRRCRSGGRPIPPRRQANDTAAMGPADRGHRRSAGSYSVANFVGILGKAGRRRAMGGQIWCDRLRVCVLEQAPHPAPVVWITAVDQHGTPNELAGPARHLVTVPSPRPSSRRPAGRRQPLEPIEGQHGLGSCTGPASGRLGVRIG